MSTKDITLLTIIGREKESSRENLDIIQKIIEFSGSINFRKVKILSAFRNQKISDRSIEQINIAPMDSRGYNKFCVENLHEYVDTNYVLMFQTDGFIVHPELWDDLFLEYDYVGAPWPNNFECRVGNGGFSLRSKKFLDATKNIEYIDNVYFNRGITPEDYLICVLNYQYMISQNINFAPIDIAIKFSYEQPIPEFPNWDHSMSLGFHGLFQGNGGLLNNFRKNIMHKYNIS